MLGERYDVQPSSHRNHDPKVCLEHERVFQFPEGESSDGNYSSLISSSLNVKVVISVLEV